MHTALQTSTHLQHTNTKAFCLVYLYAVCIYLGALSNPCKGALDDIANSLLPLTAVIQESMHTLQTSYKWVTLYSFPFPLSFDMFSSTES